MTGEAIIYGGGEAVGVAGAEGAGLALLNPVTAAVAVFGGVLFYPSELGDSSLEGYKTDYTETTGYVQKPLEVDLSNTPEACRLNYQNCMQTCRNTCTGKKKFFCQLECKVALVMCLWSNIGN